jgi:spore cortex formation protein SpoVR/YcgB (stage V sporulation)
MSEDSAIIKPKSRIVRAAAAPSSSLLYSGPDWNFETLGRIFDAVRDIAEGELGLDTYRTQIEVITSEQMLDAYSSVGMPLFYKHWSFGKDFARNEALYRKGWQGLAYEIVINSDPCICYIMEENTATMQTLVLAHAAMGHNHFFKNNYVFKQWTDASGIADYLSFAKSYISKCEERYGIEAVERLVDAAHALQSHGIHRYPGKRSMDLRSEERREQERRAHGEALFNDLWRTVPQAKGKKGPSKKKTEEDKRRAILRLPEENLLYFLEKTAPKLQGWQREILRIVRLIAQYFYPQRQTKMMNEGCATWTHHTIMTRLHQKDPSGGYDAAALQTCERARARSLLETLAGAGVDIRRGVAPELLKQERTLTDELSVKASERARLAGMKSVEASLAEVTRDLAALSTRYVKLQAQIRAASPRYVEMLEPQPLSLAEIREQVVDGQTLLLEYYLGEERSYLWAVTSTSIESFELPKRALVEAAARRVYESLIARNRRVKFETVDERRGRIAKADADYSAVARELSQMVLAPVAGRLANKRLLIVSDGALQYVPFAALPAPGSSSYEPLAVTNEIVSLPSASSLAVLRREVAKHKPAPKTIAVIADPVFSDDDPRLGNILARNKTSASNTTSAARRAASSVRDEIQRSAGDSGWDGETPNLARLPFTRKEADTIVSLVPQASRKEELDFAANLSNATSADLGQYRIIHFATHGFLNSRHPELSGIVLSLVDEKGQDQNGFLRAHEIYGLTLPAELVVLSGCRTGLGKNIRGEGVIGLTRAFMHAGAARVLVSLWDVSDEATAELITRFYRNLLGGEKRSPAAALRAAQTSMAQDKRWSAPYFWAGFTLQGEPR